MSTTIESYLAELRAQLAGADPALVQDALYDAEEYLRSEVSDPADAASVEAAVDRYGSPEEVASAYRETEATVTAALRRPAPPRAAEGNVFARFFGVLVDPGAYAALFYMFITLVTGIVYFTVAVTGVTLSASLAILIVGLPVLLLFLAIVRAISLAEGRMVEGLLGVRMPRRPRVMAQQGSVLERIKSWLTDARTWTTVLYMILMLPLGVLYFTLFTTLLATAAALVFAPVFQTVWNTPVFMSPDAAYWIAPWFMPVMVLGAALEFVLTLHLAKLIGRAHAAFAKVMLVGRPLEGSVPAPAGAAMTGEVPHA
jgi:uncharacterized membrane protein